MKNQNKTKALRLLTIWLPAVILTSVPRFASAQSCPDAPASLGVLVNTISNVFTNTHLTSYAAIDRFADLLNYPKKLDVSYDGFFESLLEKAVMAKLNPAEYIPGVNLAKDTLIDLYQLSKQGREAKERNREIAAHDWVDAEKARIAKLYEFTKDSASLQCFYASKFAKLGTAEEQDKYLSDLRTYSQELGKSIPEEERLLLDVLVHWVNDNYEFKRQLSEGLLVLKVKAESDGISKTSLKLVGPKYTDEVAKKLNSQMAKLNPPIGPFDLKIRKLILIRGTIKNSSTSDVAFFLGKKNEIFEYPSYDSAAIAREKYKSVSARNFEFFNSKFDN